MNTTDIEIDRSIIDGAGLGVHWYYCAKGKEGDQHTYMYIKHTTQDLRANCGGTAVARLKKKGEKNFNSLYLSLLPFLQAANCSSL